MLENHPKLKQFLLHIYFHPKRACPRLWARLFIVPLLPKKAKGAIIRRMTRLDISPTSTLRLGKYTTIDICCVVNNAVGEITIGDYSDINSCCTLVGPISIGNYCNISSGCKISALTHDYENIDLPTKKQGYSINPVIIEDEVWVYPNVCVNPGVRIGKHSIIGTGSVVTKDIPPYSVAVGNPARIIKQYDFEKKEWVKVKK